MAKVTTIIFLVSFLNSPAFFDKHAIDFTDMFLHLCKHPFVFLVKQVLYLLPVSINHLKTLKRTLKTSAEKLANYTREVGRLYTLSLPSILALCNRLKLRYVEFMLFSRCVLRISCFRFESMCFRVRWQWGSLHSFPKNIR